MLQSEENGKWTKDQISVAFRLGKLSVFYSHEHEITENDDCSSMLKFVHNESQEVVYSHQMKFKACGEDTFFVPGWDDRTLIISHYDRNSKDQCQLAIIRVVSSFTAKDNFMHFLLHINEDFDDDLLMDAIGILSDQ